MLRMVNLLGWGMLLALAMPVQAAPRTIHVVVALCDNQYQGIVPVPAALGNGQDPRNNLYWGAAYGVKTFFNRQNDWRPQSHSSRPASPVLERLVYKHATQDVYLVADAYDGRFIREATTDLLDYAAGRKPTTLVLETDGIAIHVGGKASLLIYVGHNGLMDFRVDTPLPDAAATQADRQVAVFACMSQQYFSPFLARTGISPAMLTTQLMAPEAYVVHALADAWVHRRTPQQVHQQVASIYSRYQKLASPARRLFTTQYRSTPK